MDFEDFLASDSDSSDNDESAAMLKGTRKRDSFSQLTQRRVCLFYLFYFFLLLHEGLVSDLQEAEDAEKPTEDLEITWNTGMNITFLAKNNPSHLSNSNTIPSL